jgi:hypothetical protein
MITPNIRYYARLELCKGDTKTPKYTITAEAGYFEPMESLKGKDGRISMYLQNRRKDRADIPSIWLQAKNSLNFTGLHSYFIDGKISGFAYGYPHDKKTYSKKAVPNPFYEYREDGFLFLIHDNNTGIVPAYIELIVLEDAKVLITAYCKQLLMGGFDESLKLLREQAKNV